MQTVQTSKNAQQAAKRLQVRILFYFLNDTSLNFLRIFYKLVDLMEL